MENNQIYNKLFQAIIILAFTSLTGCFGETSHEVISLASGHGASSELFKGAKASLNRNCTSCHRTGGAVGFARMDYDLEEQFITSGLIVPGQPNKSKLLYRTKHFNGASPGDKNMPLNGSAYPLADYQSLYSWVLSLKQDAPKLASLQIISGDQQTAWENTPTPINPSVRALDQFNNPLAGVVIAFTATNASSVDTNSVVTNAQGIASPGRWTMGSAGINTLIVSSGTVQVVLSANAVAQAPQLARLEIVSGNNQTADSGRAVAMSPVVRAIGINNQPLSGIQIIFVAANNGSVTSDSMTTNSNGEANPGFWVLGNVGVNQLTALAGMKQVTLNATATQPMSTADQRFATAKTVLGNHCISCHSSLSAMGSLAYDNEDEFLTSGMVVAGDIDRSKLIYRLKFYTGPTNAQKNMPKNSTTFTSEDQKALENWVKAMVAVPLTLSQLEKISGDNQNAELGKAVANNPVVRALDQYGNPMAKVAISFAASSGSHVESTSVVTDLNGLATPGSWTLTTVGSKQLLASSQNKSVTFTATAKQEARTPTKLLIAKGNNQQAEAGKAVANTPQVRVLDQYEQPFGGVSVTFSPMNGSRVQNSSATTDSSGYASAGSWTLGAEGTNSLLVVVNSMQVTFTAKAIAAMGTPSAEVDLAAADFQGTGANNSLALNSSIFSESNIGGVTALATTSTATNIHAHAKSTFQYSSFEYTGRMMFSNADAGIGITFLSKFRDTDKYYRLRRYKGAGAFHLSSHGGAGCSSGTSNVSPAASQWYRFKVATEVLSDKTNIAIKIWQDGQAEPGQNTISCSDTSGGRVQVGTVGVWAMGPGSKYWADLKVVDLTAPLPPSLFQQVSGILQKHCTSCHNPGSSNIASAIPFDTTNELSFVKTGLIIPRDIDGSKLINRLIHYTGPTNTINNMPAGGDKNNFSAAEYDIMVEWVAASDLPLNELPGNPKSLFLLTQTHVKRTLKLAFNITSTPDWYEPSLELHKANQLARDHTLVDAEGYFNFTEQVVNDNLAKFLTCGVSSISDACLASTVSTVGKKLFRRALSSAEVNTYKQIAYSQGNEYLQLGTRYMIIALLNSPKFLYQKFNGVNGQMTQQELASRIGFFVMEANPDETLINAASSNALTTKSQLSSHVDRLLQNAEISSDLFFNFFFESWKLNHLDQTYTAALYGPELEALKPLFEKEFEMTSKDVYSTQGGDWRHIFDYNKTFVNRSLAQHYGFSSVPANDQTWQAVSLNKNRSGLLSSGLLLAAHSGNKYTSTTHRGVFVVNDLLCQSPGVQPNNLDQLIKQTGISFPDTDTVRDRINTLATVQPCASCHIKMDPFGMVFENFNQFGQHFESRYGASVDSQSTVNGQVINGPDQLSQVLLADQDVLAECQFKKLYTFATGNELGDNVSNVLGRHGLASSQKFSFDAMVKSIVTHDNFNKVDE